MLANTPRSIRTALTRTALAPTALALVTLVMLGACGSPPRADSTDRAGADRALTETRQQVERSPSPLSAPPRASATAAAPIARPPTSAPSDNYATWETRDSADQVVGLTRARRHLEQADARLAVVSEQRRFPSVSEYVWWKNQLEDARAQRDATGKQLDAAADADAESWRTARTSLDGELRQLDRELLPLEYAYARRNANGPSVYVIGSTDQDDMAQDVERRIREEHERQRSVWNERREKLLATVEELDDVVEDAVDDGCLRIPAGDFKHWDQKHDADVKYAERYAFVRSVRLHLDEVSRRLRSESARATFADDDARAASRKAVAAVDPQLDRARELLDEIDGVHDPAQAFVAVRSRGVRADSPTESVRAELPRVVRWDDSDLRDASFAQRSRYLSAVARHFDQVDDRLDALRSMREWPSEHERRIWSDRVARLEFLYIEARADVAPVTKALEFEFDERRSTLGRSLSDMDDAMERADTFVASMPQRYRPRGADVFAK